MAKEIAVSIRDKIAVACNDVVYVCGNSDYVVVFSLDEEWAQYETKTARFSYNGTHQDKPFTGNVCPVPKIFNANSIKVGLFAGDLKTSTTAYVKARKGALCEGGTPDDPEDDVYAQLMERINALEADIPPEQIEAAVSAYLDEHPVSGLPPVTAADDGKVLTVRGGAWMAGELPKYEGAYEVTPLADGSTTLETAQKYLDSNVVVSKVPYFETSNTDGGETVYIATEVDIYGD